MTDAPEQKEPLDPSPRPPRPVRRRRIWPWVLLGTGLVVGGLVAYSPTLLGGLLLSRLGEQAGVKGGNVSGPLWSPTISNATINQAGITATVGRANITATSVNPVTRTAHLNIAVSDSKVALNLKELLSGQGGGGAGGGNGWKWVIDKVDIQNTELTVDGQGVNVPNISARLSRGEDGSVLLHGRTPEGPLSAKVSVNQTSAGSNKFTVEIDADARIARQYWKGIEAGRVKGRYLIDLGATKDAAQKDTVQGDLRVIGGVLQVPEAQFVRIADVNGRVMHRGDSITVKLAGHGWDGPITAEGGVDLKAHNWTVTADAAPTLGGLGRALHTTGEGDLKLRVTAGGWSTVRVKGYGQGAGKLAGVPFRDGNFEYTYLSEDAQSRAEGGTGAGQTNDLSFSAVTEIAGQQKLEGQWAFGRKGHATLVGGFAGKAMNVAADIDPENVLSLSGSALGGPLRGTFALKGQKIDAVLNPTFAAAKARIALSGTPEDLRATVTGGQAGPFALSGTVNYNSAGMQADFGTAKLNLDRNFKGTWSADGLSGAGLRLSGAGQLNLTSGDVTGDVQASVPAVQGQLSGPLRLNYVRQRGTFSPDGQRLTWQGDTFRLQAADLPLVGGARASGNLLVTNQLRAFGDLRVVGGGYDLSARARGSSASLRGTAGGVTVLAETNLQAPYRTEARIAGTDIRGNLSVQGGVRFSLTTLGERASGVLNGENWDVTGRVNLAALRPLLPVKDLSGLLDLNLAGLGGTAQVRASAAGAQVSGQLTRTVGSATGGRVLADLNATLPELNGEKPTANLSGQVYPAVQASGTVDYLGQTLNAALSGPYGNIAAHVTGRTGALSFGGVTLPAQGVDIRGTLTPALSAAGRWGNLNASYDAGTGLLRVTGEQALTAFGQTGSVRGRATWGPNFKGAVEARGTLDQYTVALSGPWSRLNVLLTDGEGLRGTGTASLPAGKYDIDVSGPLTLAGQPTLLVDGNIQGTGANPTGTVYVRDSKGGHASVQLRGFDNLQVSAVNLTLGGQVLAGQLRAQNGVLNGQLRAGPLNLVAQNGRLRATGEWAGQQIVASGKLTLPATVSDLQVRVTGPYLSAQASGEVANLRGSVTLRQQQYGSPEARLILPAQSFPLRASLTGARATVGGLTWQSGTWRGDLGLRYAVQTAAAGRQGGTLRLRGYANTLTALPSGPLSGRLQVLPSVGGTLTAPLAPYTGLLPAQVRPLIVAGRLVAQVRPTGATLSLQQTQYQQQPLGLSAQLDWRSGIKVQGALTHPNSRLPFVYDGQNLRVSGAALDARTLQPVLSGATGRVNLDLNVPNMQFARATGQANMNVQAQGQRAQGRVSLSAGQLSANLQSTLSGVDLRLSGPIYPKANAALYLRSGQDRLNATLTGQAEGTLTLLGTGLLSGKNINFNATGTGLSAPNATAKLAANYAGATLDATLQRKSGSGLAAWATAGTLNIPDLQALAGSAGNLSATLGGTLADVRLNATGTVSGINFSAPARYADGTLRVVGAQATLPQGTVTVSGPVFPKLQLSGKADLHDILAGNYTAQVGGTFAKPDVHLQGQLRSDLSGLQAAGTQLSARLYGKDWKADLSGPRLAGRVRGQLNSGAVGGLYSADLTLHTNYVSGQNNVRLDGPLGWKAGGAGWIGNLRATGDVPSGPLDALLTGRGTLNASGTLGSGDKQAGFTAQLPADLPLKPAGILTVTHLDAGAFWGRAGELRASGTATLGGPSWAKLQAGFAGKLDDRLGELSGDLRATYDAGNVQATMQGPNTNGQLSLRSGRYDATLKTASLRLARLLPSSMKVDALTFAGSIRARGTLSGGPEQLELQNVALRGQQAQVGPFSLYGSARYVPSGAGRAEALEASLRGSLRGGSLSAEGSLPIGLNVLVNDVPTNYAEAASFGVGKLNAALKLTGAVSNPYVSGTANVVTDALAANLALSGSIKDPQAHANLKLLGSTTGQLYADLSRPDWQKGTAQMRLYGTVQSGQNRADLNLGGVWPNLSGTVGAQIGGLKQPVQLVGNGQGAYTLSAGDLGGGQVRLTGGDGLIPKLGGELLLYPLKAVEGSSGQANVSATLGGTLSAPTAAGQITTLGASASGVTLLDTLGAFTANTGGVSGTLTQKGQTVGTLKGSALTLSGLTVTAANSTIQASGTANLAGPTGLEANLDLSASGNLAGQLKATYAAQTLALSGKISTAGFDSTLDLAAHSQRGWSGTALLSGGPNGLLTSPAKLKVSGPLAHPLATGEAGVLGAGAKIVANAQGVQVRLVDGPQATASGAVEVRPNAAGEWVWSGATSLSRPELSLSLTPSGPLADPNVLLSVRRGEWRAAGTASLGSANLSVSDGEKDGSVVWNGKEAQINLPALDLSRLQIAGVNGLVTAEGSLATNGSSGQIDFTVRSFTAPQELPLLRIRPSGDISGSVSLQGGRPKLQANAALNAGTLNLSATQADIGGKALWVGALVGNLQNEQGRIGLNLSADTGGLHGTAQISNYLVSAAGQTVTVNGQANLSGQSFSASGQAGEASAIVSANGGIADALPMLGNFFAVRPTGEGYSARALLNDIDVANLKIAPDLKGQLSGEANFNDGGGTFFVKSDALEIGPKTLPARVEGTLLGGNWRLRGFLGESDFTAGLNSRSEVFGQANLRALPLGAGVAAITGTTPGEGVVTGVARFRFPLADPAAGSATVVAERIRVSSVTTLAGNTDTTSSTASAATPTTTPATIAAPTSNGPGLGVRSGYTNPAPAASTAPVNTVTETLMGSGTLDFANRELRNINVQLSGAGTWDIQGQYTKQKVDLSAKFTNTTFTPVLRLLPGVADLQPSLKGTVTLSAAGTYDRPRGLLRAQSLVGSVAGLSLQVPDFAGDLPDSGAFTAGGRILTGGTVGSDGQLNIAGQLTLGKLSGTTVKFAGLLAPQALGALPNTTATLTQDGESWRIDALSRSTNPTTGAGSLQLSGTVSPRWDLTLAARNYNLPLSVIYAKESALTGDLRAEQTGDLIHVSGSADFARLTLGRVNAPTTIAGPAGSASPSDPNAPVNFVSPLPEEYTTFPKPVQEGETVQKPALPFLDRVVLDDVQIHAPNGIRVDENLARAEFGTTGLTVSGTAARPRIAGEILSQRGSIFLRENEFRITEGNVKFSGEGLYPTFHIVAQGVVQNSAATPTQQVPITLSVDGDFRTVAGQPNVLHLETKLSCTNSAGAGCVNPVTKNPYGEPELYALVVTGVPDLSSLPQNLSALGSSALQTALNVFVLGEIERTLAKALGVDVFRLSPTLSTDGELNATFTVGSYLTRDLFLQYQVDLRGVGLIGAKYTTPDNKFTFEVSTPLIGLNLQSIRPSFSAGYNINNKASITVGVENNAQTQSTVYKFGVTYRIGAR